jgi:hypothetical protein
MSKARPKSKPGARAREKQSTSTMMAVAKAAKVSIFTVSAVVNGTSVVSDERWERGRP